MRFSIGDLIIYGETGVCRVLDIVERPFLDGTVNCYKLEPVYSSCTIFTPVDNGNVFMRPIVTKDEADALVSSVKDITPVVYESATPRELTEKYDKIIKTHDCNLLMLFLVSIYNKRSTLIAQKKRLSAIDERYMKKAEDLLFGELAVALGIEKSGVSQFVTSMV